jgi:hypothetical protein
MAGAALAVAEGRAEEAVSFKCPTPFPAWPNLVVDAEAAARDTEAKAEDSQEED